MHAHVMAIAQPDLLFIGRETNTVTWISMSSYGAHVPTFYHNMSKLLSCEQVAHFKTKQAVYGYISKTLLTINRERPDVICKRSDLVHQRMCSWICHVQPWRSNVIQVNQFT